MNSWLDRAFPYKSSTDHYVEQESAPPFFDPLVFVKNPALLPLNIQSRAHRMVH